MLFLKWFIIVGIVYILKSLITFVSCVPLDCSRVLSRFPNQKLLKTIQIYSCFSRDINEDQAYNYSNTSLNILSFLPYTMIFRVTVTNSPSSLSSKALPHTSQDRNFSDPLPLGVCAQLATPWTVTCQALLSMEYSLCPSTFLPQRKQKSKLLFLITSYRTLENGWRT